jgi:hypothetical protein
MHRQFPRNVDEKVLNSEKSYGWLKFGDMKGEIECTIVAAKDQAVSTNYFKNEILNEETERKIRLCKQREENIDHLTSGFPL